MFNPSKMPTEAHEVTFEESNKAVRIVTLHRSESCINLGFSIRGGIEHGLGHFVSNVEPGSEADRQGLQPGDEVLTVCGLPIVGATHKEVVNYISSRWRIDLEIRRIGVIPVKNRKGDPISWHSCHKVPNNKSQRKQQESKKSKELVKIQIASPTGKRSLGCSIYKGKHPEESGIYVQTTKPGGLARRAGLRAGDQIIECNGINFEDIDLADAVIHLKSGKQLDLVVRKCSLDYLAGESSGYDSSSGASGNGVQHPIKPKSKLRVAFKSDTPQSDTEEEKLKILAEERKLLESQMEVERRKLERDQEALKKEAEKLEAEKKRFEEEKKTLLTQTTSICSEKSVTESETSGSESLASALQNEIERRRKAAANDSTRNSPVRNVPKKPELKFSKPMPAGMVKNDRHDQLMEEFRLVHRRMFANHEAESFEKDVDTKEEIVCKISASKSVDNLFQKVESSDLPPPLPAKMAVEKRQVEQEVEEIIVRPKMLPPPPPPPVRTSSITPTSSTAESPCPPPAPPAPPTEEATRPESTDVNEIPSSPGIPTPDYDSSPRSSPPSSRRTASDERPSMRNSPPASPWSSSSMTLSTVSSSSGSGSSTYLGPKRQLVNSRSNPPVLSPQWHMTTFAKRHPQLEMGSLESFSMDEQEAIHRRMSGAPMKPPDIYFDSPRYQVLLTPTSEMSRPEPEEFDFAPKQSHMRSVKVRFDGGSAAALASHDYRIAQASGRSDTTQLESELLLTLKKSGKSISPLSASSGIISDEDNPSRRILKSPKKYAAPPPPPPPPGRMIAKAETYTASIASKPSAIQKGI